jgi:hypothetical protein
MGTWQMTALNHQKLDNDEHGEGMQMVLILKITIVKYDHLLLI